LLGLVREALNVRLAALNLKEDLRGGSECLGSESVISENIVFPRKFTGFSFLT